MVRMGHRRRRGMPVFLQVVFLVEPPDYALITGAVPSYVRVANFTFFPRKAEGEQPCNKWATHGYLHQQVPNLYADRFTSAEYVMFTDVDATFDGVPPLHLCRGRLWGFTVVCFGWVVSLFTRSLRARVAGAALIVSQTDIIHRQVFGRGGRSLMCRACVAALNALSQ